MIRWALIVAVYAAVAVACFALYTSEEDNLLAGWTLVLCVSGIAGALAGSDKVLWLPLLLFPTAGVLGYPEDAYEPSPWWGVAAVVATTSFLALAFGIAFRLRWERRR
jgi:hypothetical protein